MFYCSDSMVVWDLLLGHLSVYSQSLLWLFLKVLLVFLICVFNAVVQHFFQLVLSLILLVPRFQLHMLVLVLGKLRLVSYIVDISMVWIAASAFPFILFRWDSRFPLLFIVIPRYMYVSVLSGTSSPSFSYGGGSILPMVSSWLFSFPMWNLLAMSFVVTSIFWISSLSWWMSTTSATHRHRLFDVR